MVKRFIKGFLCTGVPFGMIMGIFFGILFQGVYWGILSGIVSGLLFGGGMSVFAEIQRKKFGEMSSEMAKGEKIILEGGANHTKGAEGVGGWLCLTAKEIIFKSHALNIQVHETAIDLKQIKEIQAFNNLWIIPNGLRVVTKSGRIEKFVVNDRKSWIREVNYAINSLND